MLDYVWLIPVCPLAGVLVNALLGRWLGRRLVALVASLAVGASFLVAALVFVAMLALPAESGSAATTPGVLGVATGNGRERVIPIFSWIVAGDFQVEARILLDQLSILMVLVVTGVSTVIHVYSAGYMKDEEHHNRYFTWLNLFVFMMLILVLGDSFLTMYVGWEGVGLCSYLLIGYWFEREPAADAGKKAFLVNRVGDFGFALGIMLIFATFGSLAFPRRLSLPLQTFPGHGNGYLAAAVPGCRGQVGPDPTSRLAARRHGRPHAGQCPDPCGHDGHCRGVHGGPLPCAI
jgi:NADH-quinone oxidoreductase subunit L